MAKKKVSDKDFQIKHRTEWKDFLWQRFLEKLTATKTLKETSRVARSLFSEYEKELITKRIAALALIRSGMGVREIGRVLWMGTATINALKKSFFGNLGAYKSQRSCKSCPKSKPAQLFAQKSWLDDLLDGLSGVDVMDLLKNPPRPMGMGIKNSRLF